VDGRSIRERARRPIPIALILYGAAGTTTGAIYSLNVLFVTNATANWLPLTGRRWKRSRRLSASNCVERVAEASG
jgi:hypothetical protein